MRETSNLHILVANVLSTDERGRHDWKPRALGDLLGRNDLQLRPRLDVHKFQVFLKLKTK